MNQAKYHAADAIQHVLTTFEVGNSEYRQCFYDRVLNISHPMHCEPCWIDDLICYSGAIQTETEEADVAEMLRALVWELDDEQRQELHEKMGDHIRWGTPMDSPRCRLFCLAFDITK